MKEDELGVMIIETDDDLDRVVGQCARMVEWRMRCNDEWGSVRIQLVVGLAEYGLGKVFLIRDPRLIEKFDLRYSSWINIPNWKKEKCMKKIAQLRLDYYGP